MATSNEKTVSLVSFLGFGGLLTLLGLAIAFGEYRAGVEEAVSTIKEQQKQVIEIAAEVREQQQEINASNTRISRLEEKVYAH